MFQYRVRIPPSTNTTIVFAYDPRSKIFLSSHFSPDLVDGRATPEQVQQVLFEMELIMQFYQQNNTRVSWGIIRFFLMVLLAYLIMLIFFGIPTSTLGIVAGIFVGLAIIAGIGYSCYNKSNYKESRRLVQGVADNFNRDFTPRGLSWQLPADSLHWVELCKDYLVGEEDRLGIVDIEDISEGSNQLLTKAKGDGNEGYRPPKEVAYRDV